MQKNKKGIWSIALREWKRITSSKICIWGMMVSPMICLIAFLWMMNSGLPSQIPIAVVDLDNTPTTRALVRQLDAFEKTNILYKQLSFRDARKQMEQMEVYAVLTIPRDFTQKAISGARPQLTYYTNNAFLISGSLLFQDLKTISVLASASVGLQTAKAKGASETQIVPILQPIKTDIHPIGNPWINYSVYLNNMLLPGILQLIILIFTVSAFGCEVKARTAKQLISEASGAYGKVIIGKLLPYTILFSIMAMLFMSILYFFLKFPLHNGILPIFVNYLGLILASQALGVIAIAIFQNYRFALSAVSLIGMLSFSITGFSFSVLAMDGTLQALSNLFPLRHFFLIYVDQALNGTPWGYTAYQYAALLAFPMVACFCTKLLGDWLQKGHYEK